MLTPPPPPRSDFHFLPLVSFPLASPLSLKEEPNNEWAAEAQVSSLFWALETKRFTSRGGSRWKSRPIVCQIANDISCGHDGGLEPSSWNAFPWKGYPILTARFQSAAAKPEAFSMSETFWPSISLLPEVGSMKQLTAIKRCSREFHERPHPLRLHRAWGTE